MSSLGDLLLFHSKTNNGSEKVSESDSCDNNKDNSKTTVKNCETNQETTRKSSTLSSSQSAADLEQPNNDKLLASEPEYPKYVEKGVEQDACSNASSTDDYVRELLDPDDRPKNVWHVVEGPKVQPGDTVDGVGAGEGGDEELHSSSERNDEDSSQVLPPRSVESEVSRGDKITENSPSSGVVAKFPPSDGSPSLVEKPLNDETQVDNEMQVEKEQLPNDEKKSSRSDRRHHRSRREGSREGSTSSRRHRHRDDREDPDRHRSRRKRDYSYDDDDDQGDDRDDDRGRHKRSSSHRDYRRRSRSSRRRERSRSNSPSPVTKRNSRTILIMQLSPRVNSRDVEDFFSDIGKVREVRLIMDSKTRRHKGIAYIEFEDSSTVPKAFALNGKKLYGNPVVIQSVQSDRNKTPTSSDWHSTTSQTINYTTSHSSSRSHLPPNCYRVYVGSLNVNLTEEMIRSVFEPFGPIVRIELMKDRVTNVSRGYAFITYANTEDGQSAVQALDGFELAGKNLRVSKSADKSERYTGTTSTNTSENHSSYNDHKDPYSNHASKYT